MNKGIQLNKLYNASDLLNEINLSSRFWIVKRIEFTSKSPPINNNDRFHLSSSNFDFVSIKEIRIAIKKNKPLIGKAVAKKNVPKLKNLWPIFFVSLDKYFIWFFSELAMFKILLRSYLNKEYKLF